MTITRPQPPGISSSIQAEPVVSPRSSDALYCINGEYTPPGEVE